MKEWFEWQDAPTGDFCVLGDPVSHSLSPKMQMAAIGALGLDHSYFAIRVPKAEFQAALVHLAQLGYRGANCTVPLKEEAFRLTHPDLASQRVGAVNTIQLNSLESTNTDEPGLMSTLQSIGVDSTWKVAVLGAGGSARSVHECLRKIGVKNIFAANRTTSKLETLKRDLGVDLHCLDLNQIPIVDLVIDTTSANALGEVLAINWDQIQPETTVFSLMYNGTSPAMDSTEFLKQAATKTSHIFDGRVLLVAQGVLSLQFWLGPFTPQQIEIALKAMNRAVGL